jgi:peroxiredoxin family protein
MRATIYFAFWGLNVLRGDRPRRDVPAEKVGLFQRIFKWMMPRGPQRQRLGQLSFGGVGGSIMRRIMRQKKLMLAEEHLEQSCALNVRFVVCTMSMSVMGITQRDLVDLPNIEFAGVTSFVGDARGAGLSLVF